MEIPKFTDLLAALRSAEREAAGGIEAQTPRASLTRVHREIEHALSIVESVLTGQECALPDCRNPIEDREPGRPGRPALYCGKRCRDRAAYQTKKQRAAQRGS